MKTIEIGKHKVTICTDSKELLIKRYNQMQSFLLQESGIGNTMQDIDNHFKKLDGFLLAGKIDEARTERNNLHLALYSNIEKLNWKSFAFACLIHSIDDIKHKDFSDEGIKALIDKLSDYGLTQKQVETELEEVKKNCISN